jgi:phosphosulfolactate synthase
MKLKLSNVPERPDKPRATGLTVIQDDGLSLKSIQDLIFVSGHLIDFVRFSPGALCSGEELTRRVDAYTNAGISPFLSGIMFEAAYIRKNINEYLDFLKENHFEYIEVSDGIIEIPPLEKAEFIKNASKSIKVFSKIGAKFKKAIFPKDKWEEYIVTELNAGSQKIIIEGSEGGTSQIISGEIDIKSNLVRHILNYSGINDIIWEAPHQQQHIWFINKFGADVNLADIHPEYLLKLESQRLGLNWETLLNNIPESLLDGRLREIDPMVDVDFQI